jgi:hypothetical protein
MLGKESYPQEGTSMEVATIEKNLLSIKRVTSL